MPQINVHGRSNKILGTSQERYEANYINRDMDAASRRTRSNAEYQNNQRDMASRAMRSEADYLNAQITAGAKALRQAADYENSLKTAQARQWKTSLEREIRFKEQDFRRKEKDERKWESIRLRDERREQRQIKEEFTKRERIARFNTNFEALQEQQANRPGFFGRAVLGGARFVGGHRMHEAVRAAFGIGGRGGLGRGFDIGSGPLGAGSEMEMAASGATNRVAGMAYIAFEAAKKLAFMPQAYAALLNRVAGAAAPYTDLAIASANLGRESGIEGRDFMNRIFTGSKPPDWMWQRGITSPQQAIAIRGAYGGPISSGAEGQSVLESAGDAFMSPYIGGMPHERYAQSLGFARQIGITAPQGGVGGGGAYMSRPEYWRQFTKSAAAAQSIGLDRSQVLDNIEGLLRASIGAGAPTANVNATGDFWWRYASSGAPTARTGDMQTSVLAGQAQGIGQLGSGGGVAQNAALYMYSMKKFGGKVPSDLNAFAAGYNIDVSKLTPSQRTQLSDVHQNALAGRWLPAADGLKDFLQGTGQTQTWLDISSSALGGMPPSMRNWGVSNVSGIPLNAVYAGQGGQSSRPEGPFQITDRAREQYMDLISQGVNPMKAAGMVGGSTTEAGPDLMDQYNPAGGGAGAHGIYQLRGDRLKNYIARYGHMPDGAPIHEQNEFALWEQYHYSPVRQGTQKMDSATSPYGAGFADISDFEISGDMNQANKAGHRAEDIYNALGQNIPTDVNGNPILQGLGTVGAVTTQAGAQAAPTLSNITPDDVLKMNDGVVNVTTSLLGFSQALSNATAKLNALDPTAVPFGGLPNMNFNDPKRP